MKRAAFWLRWSLRDFRRRWIQVLATATVIAIGVAVFAGLGGMRGFRESSAEQSFAALAFHDLRVTLPADSHAASGELRRAIAAAGVPVTASEEHFLLPTQIDGRPLGKDTLTPGLLVGLPDRPSVDQLRVVKGRTLRAADSGRDVAVIDRSYARFYTFPTAGRVRLAGGAEIAFVGQGQTPQYFLITSETGFGGESTMGVIYAPLATVQRMAGQPGQVNEIVVRLPGGAATASTKAAVEQAVATRWPGSEVKLGTDEPAHTILFRDAKNDQRMMTFFGLMVLFGASIAAFNLVSRTVDAERREIGIGMALGVPTPLLAVRPLLLGAQIAIIGAVLGAVLAVWLANAFASVISDLLPLPIYTDPFRPAVFVRGAAVGFLLPFAATIWPVWRGLRVSPVDAIRVSDRSPRAGFVRASRRVKLPGGTIAQMPWRNVSRAPRRALLAVVGLGAVIGSMVALLGVVDSFNETIDRSKLELVGRAPGRLGVTLKETVAERDPRLRAISGATGVRRVDPRLDLPVTASGPGGRSLPLLVSVDEWSPGSDTGSSTASGSASASGSGSASASGSGSTSASGTTSAVGSTGDSTVAPAWLPTIDEGRLPAGPGEIAIAPRAAADLGVGVGDRLVIRAAGRSAAGAPVDRRLSLRVSGITGDPFRAFGFVDAQVGATLGLAGLTNALSVLPTRGTSAAAVQRELATSPIVAAARPVTADAQALSDTVAQFTGIIQVAAGAAFVLAVLMAFNLASIAIDERRREYATMFAFGMPVGRGLRIGAVENLIVGVLATLVGLLIARAALSWIITSLFTDTWPEIGIEQTLAPSTLALAAVVGILAVAATPYLLSRRLTRMDIPSTLRVVE